MKKRKTIDTNLLIRYLAEDDPVKAEAVEKLFREAEKGELEIPDLIVAEMAWVLLSFYELGKEEVVEKIEGLLALEKLKINRPVLAEAVEIYRKRDLSFVAAYLAAYSLDKGRAVYSFDGDLAGIRGLKRIKP